MRHASGPWRYLFGDISVISDDIARQLAEYGHVSRMPKSDLPGISSSIAGYHDSGETWGWWLSADAREFGWPNSEAGRNAVFVTVDGPCDWANALCATALSHMGEHAPVREHNETEHRPRPMASGMRITGARKPNGAKGRS